MNQKLCPLCGSIARFLGKMGALRYYRCTGCGMDHFKQTKKKKTT